MKNNRGMALVVALLTSFILLALVASLFWVIASTSRQAEYARNSAIALNLAEAGTEDAIYRLNYCTGTDPAADAYPFLGTYIPFDLTSSDTFTLSDLPELPPAPTGSSYASYGIKRNLGNGYYVVGVLQETADLTKGDTIISVGTCKGVRRTLSVGIRGKGDGSKIRNVDNQGISEAFNKHAVYCNLFTANSATVNGNIVCVDDISSTFPTAGNWTKTKISVSDPPLPNRIYFESIGTEPSPSAISSTYNDPGGPYPYNNYNPGGGGPTVTVYAGPIFWFDNDVINVPIEVMGAAQFRNNSIIEAYTKVNGNVQIRDQSIVRNFLDATGSINIYETPTIEAGANVCVKGSSVTFDPASLGIIINGGLVKATNNIDVVHSGANTNAYLANFFAGGQITVEGGSSAAKCKIGDANTDVYVIGLGGVTLRGADIKGTCYSQSTIWLGVKDNNVQPNGKNVPALIMDKWGLGSATITIQTAGTTHNIDGLVYSAGGGSAIVISSGTVIINGALVADGTVQLSSGTSLNYVPSVFESVSSDSDIFSGFSSGRRTYVPVWQGWRLR